MNSLKDTKEFILLFKDPFTGKNIKAVCSKWPAKMDLNFTEFACDFVEVP